MVVAPKIGMVDRGVGMPYFTDNIDVAVSVHIPQGYIVPTRITDVDHYGFKIQCIGTSPVFPDDAALFQALRFHGNLAVLHHVIVRVLLFSGENIPVAILVEISHSQ